MPKPNGLSSLFRSAIKPKLKPTSSSSSTSKRHPYKPSYKNPSSPSSSLSNKLKLLAPTSGSGAVEKVKQEISHLLNGSSSLSLPTSEGENLSVDIPWITSSSQHVVSTRRKEVSRVRKGQWIFKNTQAGRFNQVIKNSAQKLGSGVVQIFKKLGRETGEKEYSALINVCLEKAKESDDENVQLENVSNAFEQVKAMKDRGFQIQEGTYGPLLLYLIDKGMVEEFHLLCELLNDGNHSPLPRLYYYEMMLHIRHNNEEKVQELCRHLTTDNSPQTIQLRENYLLALCDGDRKDELCNLLKDVDITKILSLDHITCIFKSLGRLQMETFAEKFLLALKESKYDSTNISTIVFAYATSIPNLAKFNWNGVDELFSLRWCKGEEITNDGDLLFSKVEDVVSRFQDLHGLLELSPSSKSYEKLVNYSCDLLKVHAALDIVDQMDKAGLPLSLGMLQHLLRACDECYEFNLVWRIYSLIWHHGFKPDVETFRILISLCVKMKDFDGAYNMLKDLKKLNLEPTATIYNSILGGYFREKKNHAALMVLRQMIDDGVKPDSSTYSYLISNSDTKEEIIEYCKDMEFSGTKLLKPVFMALINAYAALGEYEKAKQVLLDERIPINNRNEVKSVLISALALSGQMDDALAIYDEMKQAGCTLEPKAVVALIEHFQSEGGSSRLLNLLEEINGHDLWVDGCYRVLLYCVRNKHLSDIDRLLRQLKDAYCNNELAMEVMFDEVFCAIAEMEPTDLVMGLSLLQFIKKELGVFPSRKSLDFLLSACIKAKDLQSSLFIWEEYPLAGLPYNVLSYLRMYHTLLASGGHERAKTLLGEISKDDPHVCILIEAFQDHYCGKRPVPNIKCRSSTKKKKSK